MAELSGANATFKENATPVVVPDTLSWRINPTVTTNAYATNSTSGWKKRTAGVKDWTATVSIILDDTTAVPFTLGTSYDLEFHVDAGGSNYYDGAAFFEGVTHEADIDGGTNQVLELQFGGNGALSENGSVVPL